MAVTAVIGTGLALSVGGSSWTYPILSVNGPGMTREKIDATKMSTTSYKEYLFSNLVDPGELEVECEYDGNPPTFSTSDVAISVTYSNSQVLAGTGRLIAFNPSTPLEDKMTCSCTFAFSGSISGT